MDKLHHVAIVVSDIAQALEWYRDQFEVETVYTDDSWALLRFKNIDLALVLPNQHPPHIAVERANADAYGALTPHRDGSSSVYIEDPWGNSVEIMKTGE